MTIKELLTSYGYNDKEIETLINSYSLMKYKEDTLKQKIEDIFEFLINMGYSKKEIVQISKSFPAIFSYTTENMK